MRPRVAIPPPTASDQLYSDAQKLFHEPYSRHACAAKMFKAAVELDGHAQSANMLAYMYLYGMGVTPDVTLSTEYALIAMMLKVHTPTVLIDRLLKSIFESAARELLSDDEMKNMPPQILVPQVMRHLREDYERK